MFEMQIAEDKESHGPLTRTVPRDRTRGEDGQAISGRRGWFDVARGSESDRLKIGRTNAASLFRLKLAGGQR